MGLQRYRQKRDFSQTPEPRGEGVPRSAVRARSGDLPRFLIRRPRASSLHFDLSLEIDGVLKSWAISRDPSDDTVPKHLALQTEDHPVEYEYGAAPMDIWDRGTWVPEGSALASLRRGTLKFELKGKRMKGRWALLRMGNATTRKKDLWLLVKRAERDASR